MSQELYIPLEERQPGAIAPELLANKLAALQRLQLSGLQAAVAKRPRIIEALWFIQWMSMQPGGLEKFSGELLAGLELGTKTMRALGNRKYTTAECKVIWNEISSGEHHELEERVTDAVGPRRPRDRFSDFDDDAPSLSESELKAQALRWDREFEKTLSRENAPYFQQLCHGEAKASLCRLLDTACGTSDLKTDPWYCADLFEQLIRFMDSRAKQIEARIAPTAVTLKVFDALDYANTERVMVRIAGDPRFGKTESIETWADMWPGRARVVRTPSSNSERDLFKAVAEAFGIQHGHGVNAQNLKDKVEFVIRFSGLALIFDEAAFLVPSQFSATTPPARLNWVRCAIVDRKIPCVLVVTPQSYASAVNRFVKKTSYSIEQFLGREALRVDLPNELSHEDLIAVARIHFPGEDEDLLGLVVAKAMQSESYLKAVEHIAKRARYNSKKRGAKKLSVRDVDTAIAEVMPQAAPVDDTAPAAPRAARLPRRRSAAAKVLQTQFRDSAEDFPARNTTPLELQAS